jgi:hypothetical protein
MMVGGSGALVGSQGAEGVEGVVVISRISGNVNHRKQDKGEEADGSSKQHPIKGVRVGVGVGAATLAVVPPARLTVNAPERKVVRRRVKALVEALWIKRALTMMMRIGEQQFPRAALQSAEG